MPGEHKTLIIEVSNDDTYWAERVTEALQSRSVGVVEIHEGNMLEPADTWPSGCGECGARRELGFDPNEPGHHHDESCSAYDPTTTDFMRGFDRSYHPDPRGIR